MFFLLFIFRSVGLLFFQHYSSRRYRSIDSLNRIIKSKEQCIIESDAYFKESCDSFSENFTAEKEECNTVSYDDLVRYQQEILLMKESKIQQIKEKYNE